MNSNCGIKIKTKIALALVMALLINFGLTAKADDTVDSLNAQKSERQKKLDEINKKIKGYTQQIETTKRTSNTLKNEVAIYEKQIASTELQIEGKKTQIEDTNLQIGELEKLIEQKINSINENKKVLAELLTQLNEFDDSYLLNTTFGSGNLSDFLDQIQATQNFQDKIYQVTQKIKEIKLKLEANQKDLKIQLANLEELKKQMEITQQFLVQQRNQKQVLLAQTRGLEKNFQRLLAVSKEEEENLEKEVADLDAKIRAKLGNKTILASKGALAWPMDGILTQKYGNTGFRALGYNFHNGIDVAAPAGQPIYAAASGTVLYTDSSDASYGNWVAIKHTIAAKTGPTNIIALYAHFRSFKVSPGQAVKAGDLIGYEGNTGNTTKRLYGPERGYHIHFGVYDVEGFGVNDGKYSNIYGPYKVPYGYTYNPLDFL